MRPEPRGLVADEPGSLPEVRLRSVSFSPFLYRKMIDQADRLAEPGGLVRVVDPRGETFGFGLFNPRSEIVVRMLAHGPELPPADFWQRRLSDAASLRQDLLRLDEVTDAYRLVHAEADGLSGLVVDRLAGVLSAEAFSLGIYQRGRELLASLAARVGVAHYRMTVDPLVEQQEGFLAEPIVSPEFPKQVTINEHGTRFRIRFEVGHKTGFFCDQRDNRLALAKHCKGRTLLDLCCNLGGFAVQAKRLGAAAEVTAVDLDEQALAVAKENANLNQARIQFVHADAFAYMRDILRAGREYDVLVLDPPKLIRSRDEIELGSRKYFDMNRLAMQLVRPGGLLLTCSCSGLLPESEFLRLLAAAGRQAGGIGPDGAAMPKPRTLQILAKTGAAADHPLMASARESEYLKAMWLRVL